MLTIQKKQAKYFAFRREKALVESGLYLNLYQIWSRKRDQTYKILIASLHVIEALLIKYVFSPTEYTLSKIPDS